MFIGISFVHWLVVLSALVSIVGSGIYIKNTLTGTTKPNRVSYFLWASIPLLAAFAALSAGADTWATSRIFLSGFLPLSVLFASFFNPHGHWKLTAFDYLCGSVALAAVALWVFADSPVSAVLFFAVADVIAAFPTVRKAFLSPETETKCTYILSIVSVLLMLPSVPVWNIQNSAFQLCILVMNVIIVFALYHKKLFFLRWHH